MALKNRLRSIRMSEYEEDQKDFAERLKIKKSTYSQYENSESRPYLDEAFRIARALGKTVDQIWFWVDD